MGHARRHPYWPPRATGTDFVGGDTGAPAAMTSKKKSEFFAAQSTSNGAGLSQSIGNGTYDGIATRVAVSIVDRLEPVDIEQQQRNRLPHGLCVLRREHLIRLSQEGCPVEEFGHLVGISLPDECGL